jgi:uncharacterized protein (TIGR02246 family)
LLTGEYLEDRPMSSELQGVCECWFQAWLDKDAATVEQLMAADYVYVGPAGVVLDRQAILAIIRSPTYRLDRFARTEVVVRTVGPGAALVRDQRQAAGSLDGAAFTEDHRGVMVWERRAGDWRLVMEQCSLSDK